MSEPRAGRYTVGIDFGTESARAVLVNVTTGEHVATAVSRYRNGVIDERLPPPDEAVVLDADWALQDPRDYILAVREAVPAVMRASGVAPASVIGIGIDFTSCTMLPVRRDGTPLCVLPEFRSQPHAWVKLWKHHAAQPEADRITDTAQRVGEPWLPRYGGRISSEWFFSKALQILDEAPAIYHAAERLIEAADWIVWQLTGNETRNACTAGYKALWSRERGFPERHFFEALDPRFGSVIDDKMSRAVLSPGTRAGGLTAEAAGWTGLDAGTAVAVANVDAHVSVPAATVTQPGRMVAVMGTSTCHLVLADRMRFAEGMCGAVEDGIVPGLVGYEAGQPGVGDMFAWFVANAVPASYHRAAEDAGLGIHDFLAAKAAELAPGESGMLALDWWNGNRSILVDAGLTGVVVGATLATRAPAIYRTLIESTAFGTRLIIDSFVDAGIAVDELIACGGLPLRNAFLMQVYADVTGLVINIAASTETPALGAAMFAAVAAGPARGGHATIVEATERMAHLSNVTYRPVAANRRPYDALYREYVRLHDHFGRGGTSVMETLRRLRAEAVAARSRVAEPASAAAP